MAPAAVPLLMEARLEATAATVDLGPPHEPGEESIKAFKEVEHELKKHLIHTRHEHNSGSIRNHTLDSRCSYPRLMLLNMKSTNPSTSQQ